MTGPVLAVALLGACNAQKPPPQNEAEPALAAGPKVDPCSLLTAAEVSSIIGDKIIATAGDSDSCRYSTDDSDGVELEYSPTGGQRLIDVDRKAGAVLADMAGRPFRRTTAICSRFRPSRRSPPGPSR